MHLHFKHTVLAIAVVTALLISPVLGFSITQLRKLSANQKLYPSSLSSTSLNLFALWWSDRVTVSPFAVNPAVRLDRPIYGDVSSIYKSAASVAIKVGQAAIVGAAAYSAVSLSSSLLSHTVGNEDVDDEQESSITESDRYSLQVDTMRRQLPQYSTQPSSGLVKSISAQCIGAVDSTINFVNNLVFGFPTLLDTEEWNIGTLQRKTEISGGFTRYRISFASRNNIFPIGVAQEVCP